MLTFHKNAHTYVAIQLAFVKPTKLKRGSLGEIKSANRGIFVLISAIRITILCYLVVFYKISKLLCFL
jgi:hypothetical protein